MRYATTWTSGGFDLHLTVDAVTAHEQVRDIISDAVQQRHREAGLFELGDEGGLVSVGTAGVAQNLLTAQMLVHKCKNIRTNAQVVACTNAHMCPI